MNIRTNNAHLCHRPTRGRNPNSGYTAPRSNSRDRRCRQHPRTSISHVVSPPSLAGPGAAWCPGGTGTGRRLRQRAPAPASPLSSAHPAGRAQAPPGVPGAPEQAGAPGNAPPDQHLPCRQPTQPGGPRRRLASRGHRNRPAPAATRPRTSISPVVSPPSLAGPGAAWRPGGTGAGRHLRQRAPAPASPLSSAHPAWRAPAPPGVPGAPEQAGACGASRCRQGEGQGAHGAMPPQCTRAAPPGRRSPASPHNKPQGGGHAPRSRVNPPPWARVPGMRPAHTAPARRTHNATHPRTSIPPVVSPPRRKRGARARIRDTQLRVCTECFQIPEALPGCCPVRSNRKYHLV